MEIKSTKFAQNSKAVVTAKRFSILSSMPAKRKYKDSVFTSLFKDKKRLLELSVRVLNINKGHNPKLEQRSESLAGYSAFVAKVREFQFGGNTLKEAIENAVRYCIGKGILSDYLRQNSSVVNMMSTEFKLKDALAVAREEGAKKLLALWEKGVPLAEAKRRLGVSRNYAVR